MELQLKHLAPYLPYELKAIHEFGQQRIIDYECQTYTNSVVGLNHIITKNGQISRFKPILRPLSELCNLKIELSSLLYRVDDNGLDNIINDIKDGCAGYDVMQLCFENHIDVFGLIESGLAVDINTIKK